MQGLLRRSWVQVVIGALALMAVTVISGRPTVFTDTDDYYAQGRGAAQAVKPLFKAFLPKPADGEDEVTPDADEDHTSMAARSPYYGIFLYVSNKIGTLWLLAALQSVAAAWTVWAMMRGAAPKARVWVYPAIMAGLAAGTTLPFFTGFAMPDLFAALGAAATAALAVYWDRYSWAERLGLWLMVTASLWFHTSHVILEAALIVCIAVLLWWFRTERRVILLRSALFAVAILSALGSDIAYHAVVRLRTGEDLHRPPFLAARVLADGPGRVYLREVCAHGTPYVLCRFRLNPLDDSDEILWADDPARGIFNASKINIRIAIENEEKKFVLATVAHHPLSQIGASLSNWWEQLSLIDLAEPLRDPAYFFTNIYWKDTSLPALIPGGAKCVKSPRLCRSRLDITVLWWIDGAVIALSSAFLIWRVLQRDFRAALLGRARLTPDGREALLALGLLLALAVLMNAGITGILSGPFARYHARMVWLIPGLAMLVCAAAGPGFDVKAFWAELKRRARS